jgi:hypothetical protein
MFWRNSRNRANVSGYAGLRPATPPIPPIYCRASPLAQGLHAALMPHHEWVLSLAVQTLRLPDAACPGPRAQSWKLCHRDDLRSWDTEFSFLI